MQALGVDQNKSGPPSSPLPHDSGQLDEGPSHPDFAGPTRLSTPRQTASPEYAALEAQCTRANDRISTLERQLDDAIEYSAQVTRLFREKCALQDELEKMQARLHDAIEHSGQVNREKRALQDELEKMQERSDAIAEQYRKVRELTPCYSSQYQDLISTIDSALWSPSSGKATTK
jgi:predicted  nucleic acid-binding Zn-ribbon protein